MAKSRRKADSEPTHAEQTAAAMEDVLGAGITATIADVQECVSDHDIEVAKYEVHREGARAALEPLEQLGMVRAALRVAMKLRKLEPTKRRAWFVTFRHACESLGLEAQLDIEDLIAERAEAERPGRATIQ
jgi:hypothetical protein